MDAEQDLNIIVVGASGDLAQRKIFPALFAVFSQDLLPENVRFFGFARSSLEDQQFRERVSENLTCRYVPDEACDTRMQDFLARCHYTSGQYDDKATFLDLYARMREVVGGPVGNSIFYLAIPPSVFLDVARSLGDTGMVHCGGPSPWSRVVIEKPFGRDRASSDELAAGLARVFTEDQTYRIDHYLGKEVIQDVMVLRFANLVFEPLWSWQHVERIWIDWREDLSLEGRAGYFDDYGIIRDVMQNHLLQILALVTMEKPDSVSARHVRDRKVELLRAIRPLTLDDVVLGQYGASEWKGKPRRAYCDEPNIASDARTPTFAAAALCIDNDRWRGVPMIMRAGKGLNKRESEVRIQFRDVPGNIFRQGERVLPANELVIRIQPDEGLYLSVVNKAPGLDLVLDKRELNLQYESAYSGVIPDAYECLLLDVVQGDKSLFIRDDELRVAWDIFTPVLHDLEDQAVAPEIYPFGSRGPSVDRLLD